MTSQVFTFILIVLMTLFYVHLLLLLLFLLTFNNFVPSSIEPLPFQYLGVAALQRSQKKW